MAWLYPVADAAGQACVVEAGRRLDPGGSFPVLRSHPGVLSAPPPGLQYIEDARARYGTPAPAQGLVVRGSDYRYPESYLEDWNPGLWRQCKEEVRLPAAGAPWSFDMFGATGYINPTWSDRNCPGPFYYAPQRERRPDVLIATNHCISPEMRMTSMSEWTALLTSANVNDIQWRYDELNREIHDALERSAGGIDTAAAWDLVNFLRPDGRFPRYYNPGALDWHGIQVHGSVTLCELTARTLTSLFGYYGDEPVTIHLDTY